MAVIFGLTVDILTLFEESKLAGLDYQVDFFGIYVPEQDGFMKARIEGILIEHRSDSFATQNFWIYRLVCRKNCSSSSWSVCNFESVANKKHLADCFLFYCYSLKFKLRTDTGQCLKIFSEVVPNI